MINSILASTLLVHEEASNETHHMTESFGFNWPITMMGYGWFVMIVGTIILILIAILLIVLTFKLNKK